MRTLVLDEEKIKLIVSRLNALKQTFFASSAEELAEKNQYINTITAKIVLFQNQTFTFSDAIFIHNPIVVYKKILSQKESENTEEKIKKTTTVSRLQNISCYRMTLLRNDLPNYALERVERFLISREQIELKSDMLDGNDLFQSIFSEMQKNKMTQLKEVNDALLESLLELIVLEKIYYRLSVILALENMKERMEYNDIIKNLIFSIESCDGKYATMCRLIESVTKDRPGLFFNWRPEIGYGELYNHLKFLQEEIGKGALLNAEIVLPQSTFVALECGCL